MISSIMSGGIETAGDIATGALIGRAVEPRAGEGSARIEQHGLCLNCGTALIADYCHACGQGEHVHRSLPSIGHDLLHGVFHFEGKIWRTLPMLVLHPGELTRRYIAGERARFVSPLALFLFSVFLMFATIHSFSGELEVPGKAAASPRQIAQIDKQIAEASRQLNRAEAEHARQQPGIPDSNLIAARTVLASLQRARGAMTAGEDGKAGLSFKTVDTGWPTLDKGIDKARANPGLALYKLQSSAYKFSWTLIPISLPFIALLFLWRRHFSLYDHAIFVTYSLGFMMLFVVLLTISGAIGVWGSLVTLAALTAPPIHMFAQLRGAYSLPKRSALWRTVVLMIFAFVALVAYFGLLLVLGLME